MTFEIKPIAHIHTNFPTKFGIPRQSGIVATLRGTIVFEPEYSHPEALRGIEGFSHLWLIWQFSEAVDKGWSPTVRPPRLGGNKRMGVFATRSPFRPNSLGLSSVVLESVEMHPTLGPLLHVCGADLMHNTPIFDIKPYIAYSDSHPEASGGFARESENYTLEVDFPKELLQQMPAEHRQAVLEILAHDPRPSYQNDPERVYGMPFAGFDIKFCVENEKLSVKTVDNTQLTMHS